ncbi:alpha/beta fold hydrolase [Streptomyces sp. NPDC056568]|uniref:alpha/beta fold hydrolase n=1 Tax=Streptomyces sp. NPDC056568 TaxID=3345866 RepID=UPI003695692F
MAAAPAALPRGLPLVAVPGMLCDADLWSEVDFPAGHEVRHVTPGRADIGSLADDVLASVDGPFVLVGLSLGAIVGFEALRRAPERIAGLCVMSTNAAAPRAGQRAQWRTMTALITAGRYADVVERTLPGMFAEPVPRREDADRYRRMARAVGSGTALGQLAAQATRVDAVEALRGARCPAVVLCGTRDALCPPEFHRVIARALPEAALREVPGAGHLLPWERPAAVSDALRELLATVERRRAPTTAHRPPVPAPGP